METEFGSDLMGIKCQVKEVEGRDRLFVRLDKILHEFWLDDLFLPDEIDAKNIARIVSAMIAKIDGLQQENTALRDRIAILEAAAGAEATDLAMAANAAKAARAADKAGYEAIIKELRAEIRKQKGGAK